jgi:nucleolar protein 12
MLPRALRVTRAKDPRKTTLALERSRAKHNIAKPTKGSTKYTAKATPEQQSMAGRAGKLLGRSGAARQRKGKGFEFKGDPETQSRIAKTPEDIVFEGRRASVKDGRPAGLKLGKKVKSKGRSAIRSRNARRAADWRKK